MGAYNPLSSAYRSFMKGQPLRTSLSIPACLAAMLVAGCAPSGDDLYRQMQGEDPDERIEAIVQAGRQRDRDAVPHLVDRLTDSEADVRFFAIASLERITGETMGYEYYAPAPQRHEAVERWREWLRSRAPAATRPASQPAGAS